MGKSIIPIGGNDRIDTPDDLARKIVQHFNPYGKKCLEPCRGGGSFIRAFESCGINPEWCEIDDGRDFLDYTEQVDWIITNPPYSKLTSFIEKGLTCSDNIVFLCLGNAMFFKKRLRLIKEAGYGIKEMVWVDTPPKPWPQFGIQLAVVHIAKGHDGLTRMTYNL